MIQKPQFGHWRSSGYEIVPDEKYDLVVPCLHLIRGEQRYIRATVGIGFGRGDKRAILAVNGPQFDFHSLSRATVRGVQDVCAEFGGHIQE